MHVAGKILVWVSLPVAAAGFIMAARLVDTRGKWMDRLQKAKVQNEKVADELTAARLEREQARAELERESLRWDRYWSDVTGQYIPQNNTITANVGSAKGISSKAILYAFQLEKNAVPAYVGSFSVLQLQPTLSSLKPAFRVRPDDVSNWTGGNWRFRTMIPSSFASRIAGLEADLVVADELLAKQQSNLETQSKLVDAARQQREERIAELLGDPKANPPLPGLVAEITEADDVRNVSLVKVDRLRRDISAAEEHTRQLIQENKDLARTLQSRSTQKLTALTDLAR
jgi:hypothetical protein